MTADRFDVPTSDGAVLAGERRGRVGAMPVVFLHAGVADRRSWQGVLDRLEGDDLDLVAVDRRGYGASPDARGAFTHLADLLAVLEAADADRAVVVGNSMGGALALDLALTEPDRVASLLLVAAGASGMTDEGEPVAWAPDPATGAILEALEAAERSRDLDEAVRLQLHLWLDGPTAEEGRVGGPSRELAATMSGRILAAGAGEGVGDAGLDAWHALGDIAAPTLTVWGDLDAPPDLPFYALMGERLPHARTRVLPGVAHLPSLEQPDTIAALVREAVALAGSRP